MSKRFTTILIALAFLMLANGTCGGNDAISRPYRVFIPDPVNDPVISYNCAAYEYLDSGTLYLSDCCPVLGLGKCENSITVIEPKGVQITENK